MREKVIEQLCGSGFEEVPLNENGMKLYRYLNGARQHIVWLIEESAVAGMNKYQYRQYVNAIQTLRPEGVYSTTIFTVFFSSRQERCRKLCGEDGSRVNSYWIVDTTRKMVVIDEGQPDDYAGLRRVLADFQFERGICTSGFLGFLHRFRNIGYVTIGLAVANVLIFIFSAINGLEDTAMSFGCSWHLVFKKGEVYRLFTAVFLHASISHIVGNLTALVIFGMVVERWLRSSRFLLMYCIAGIGSFVASACGWKYIAGAGTQYSVGASGAIYGIIGATIVLWTVRPETRKSSGGVSPWLAVLYVLVSNGVGIVNAAIYRATWHISWGKALVKQGVDIFAHLGGVVIGALIFYIMYMRVENRRDE
jgi:membrane associated rhomboid family serine protease